MALTKKQKRLLKAATEVAQELALVGAGQPAKEGQRRGRELTPLIGELNACEKLNLTWEPSDGYDARTGHLRVQVKTRKSWSTPTVNPAGRLGRFGRKKGYPFDIAVYIELDDDFNTASLWCMGVEGVKALEEAERGS
ncbi:MAG: hypothetical protein V3V35_07200, partial [Dehalococcoidia bacterium]